MNAETWDLVRLGLEGFGCVIMTALGFVVNSLRGADKRQSDAIDHLTETVNDMRASLAEKYVQRQDFTAAVKEVKESVDDIRKLLLQYFQKGNRS